MLRAAAEAADRSGGPKLLAVTVLTSLDASELAACGVTDSGDPAGLAQRQVLRLAGLFALDSLGGGFVVQSFIVYWLAVQFHASIGVLGVVFFSVGLLQTAALYGLGYALLPLATSVPLFLLYQVFLPLGTALLFPATSALVSHRTDQHEFGLMMGVQQGLRGVASVAGPIWAGLAYQHLGPSVPFFACAVIIACALLLATRVPRGAPVPATA